MRVWLVVESTSFGGRNGVESWCKRQPIVGGSPRKGCGASVIVETTSFSGRNPADLSLFGSLLHNKAQPS